MTAKKKTLRITSPRRGTTITSSEDVICWGWMVMDNLLCLKRADSTIFRAINLNNVIEFEELD